MKYVLKNIRNYLSRKYKEKFFKEEIRILRSLEKDFLKEVKFFLLSEKYISKRDSIKRLSKLWGKHSIKELNGLPPSEEFYKKWVGRLGVLNIAANSIDQFKRPYLLRALRENISDNFKGKILDYGCGTASFSLSYQKKYTQKSQVILSDVKNLSLEFVRDYAKRNNKFRIKIVDVDLKKIKDKSIDVILCIDVLEHLKNPSETFLLLDKKLKKEGLLFLKAPWGGHPEHLKEAPLDWKGYGKNYLKDNYKILKRFNYFRSPSGVYKKIR